MSSSKPERVPTYHMRPTVNIRRIDDEPVERVDQIEDLADRAKEVRDAEQVKGGFDPQPDPPKLFIPPRPPALKPGLILPY
jgi:hypothetical protein